MSSIPVVAALDPYTARANALTASFYPTPTSGFNARLLGLLGVTAYLCLITVIYLVAHFLASRKQGKKIWAWRIVQKPEGNYIMANIYVASVVPSVFAAILIGGLLFETRSIFLYHADQQYCFLWRNLIWILVWLQGWISSFANVQAVLITSPAKASPRLPIIINTLYIVFPIFIATGLLVTGTISSFSFDATFATYSSLLPLLATAASQYQVSPLAVEPSVQQAVETALSAFASYAEGFYNEYLALLVFWTFASLSLLVVNMAGIFLVLRLKSQVNLNSQLAFSNHPSPLLRKSTTSTTHIAFSSTPSSLTKLQPVLLFDPLPKVIVGTGDEELGAFGLRFIDELEGGEKAWWGGAEWGRRRSRSSATRMGETSQSMLEKQWSQGRLKGREELTRSMEKLIFDLIVTISAVTFICTAFTADTIFLATKRETVFADWVNIEAAITVVIYSYVLTLAFAIALLTANECVHLWRTPRRPDIVVRNSFAEEYRKRYLNSLKRQKPNVITRHWNHFVWKAKSATDGDPSPSSTLSDPFEATAAVLVSDSPPALLIGVVNSDEISEIEEDAKGPGKEEDERPPISRARSFEGHSLSRATSFQGLRPQRPKMLRRSTATGSSMSLAKEVVVEIMEEVHVDVADGVADEEVGKADLTASGSRSKPRQ